MYERGTPERPIGFGPPRKKGGLETPLHGRLIGENKRLVFAPPIWYDLLVVACLAAGLLMMFSGVVQEMIFGSGGFIFGLFVGVMVLLAGVWAAFSNERMTCDLRSRTYVRLEGQGLRKRITKGRLTDLDALVLLAEQWPVPVGAGLPVIYRLVLHWKGGTQPLLVVDIRRRVLPAGQPLNSAAGDIFHQGDRFSKALQVPYYDNSYYHSPCPVPIAQ